jgi:prophage maintenance system killer protein
VTALDAADLVLIAGRTLGIEDSAALAQMDIAVAQEALAEAGPLDRDLSDAGAAAAAAAGLMRALLRHRPFPRQGQQLAVAAGLQFLSLNGWRADLNPPATAAVVVEALASGQLAPAAAAAWLAPRLSPARDTSSRGSRPNRPRGPALARPGTARAGWQRAGTGRHEAGASGPGTGSGRRIAGRARPAGRGSRPRQPGGRGRTARRRGWRGRVARRRVLPRPERPRRPDQRGAHRGDQHRRAGGAGLGPLKLPPPVPRGLRQTDPQLAAVGP